MLPSEDFFIFFPVNEASVSVTFFCDFDSFLDEIEALSLEQRVSESVPEGVIESDNFQEVLKFFAPEDLVKYSLSGLNRA